MNPKTINVAVAEQIEKLGSDKVINTVIEKLANAEVTKRADALAAAIKLAEETIKEQRKVSKGDLVSIDAEGKKTESFSPKAFEAKKKIDEKLARIDTVVTNATEKGDWGKLYELVKNSGQAATAETKTDDESANT
jgi:hypothetical protein